MTVDTDHGTYDKNCPVYQMEKTRVQKTRTMATKKSLNCALINIQSVTSKTLEIRELIAEKSLDILALTET